MASLFLDTFRIPFFAFSVALTAVACASGAEDDPASEQELLPNGTLVERAFDDGESYRTIANAFRERGLDVKVHLASFDPRWPLDGGETSVLNRVGTPIYLGWSGYFHTGFDVIRNDVRASDAVVAPHDGLALVFDGLAGTPGAPSDPYRSVVAIWDSNAHVITQMTHVQPNDVLARSGDPVRVARGDVVGKLVPPRMAGPAAGPLAHAHVVFVDAEKLKLLNPASLFRVYRDEKPPSLKRVYVADESARLSTKLVSGNLDLIAEVFDPDNESRRNFEVSAIAFEVKADDGRTLLAEPRCELDHIYESIAAPSSVKIMDLIDFATARREQLAGAWPNSDIDNRARTFRYALTQLHVEAERCTVVKDAPTFVTVTDDVHALDVAITLWDAKNNTSRQVTRLAR